MRQKVKAENKVKDLISEDRILAEMRKDSVSSTPSNFLWMIVGSVATCSIPVIFALWLELRVRSLANISMHVFFILAFFCGSVYCLASSYSSLSDKISSQLDYSAMPLSVTKKVSRDVVNTTELLNKRIEVNAFSMMVINLVYFFMFGITLYLLPVHLPRLFSYMLTCLLCSSALMKFAEHLDFLYWECCRLIPKRQTQST